MDLNDSLEEHFRLVPAQKNALKKIGLLSVGDLLYHFPTRYGDTSAMKNVGDLAVGEVAVVFGKISGLKTSKAFRKKIPMAEAFVEDETGKIKIVWFHQPYLAKMIGENSFVRIEGKVTERRNELYFSNPKIENVAKLPIAVGDSLFGSAGEAHTLYPVYPESRGITSNWFYHALQRVFKSGILDDVVDPIPEEILFRYNLPSLKSSFIFIHTPQKQNDAMGARKRFAFQEVFFIQLGKQKERKEQENQQSFVIEEDEKSIESFTSRFPFKETTAQKKAIATILNDLKSGQPMSRLLEGDVGSGKTAVAATSVYAVTSTRPKGQDFGNLQTAYMVPTEILAKQHFQSFIKYFAYLGINIGLITGSGCLKFPSKIKPTEATPISRAQLLKWVANGEIPILVGTHSLIQKTVKFKNLAYVIIDEQHRFGTSQRRKLRQKDAILPHLLSMTATPIPRTLALTVYGDLDLSLLDEMPAGRKPIITEIVPPNKREDINEKIRIGLKEGRQLYVICPRINEPDPEKEQALIAKSAKEEAKRLKKDVFPEYSIDVMHSKMTPKAKDEVMERFENGKTDILVSTSVVEVGVNVPNATMMIIEGGERFGLAQLHQLRGRIIRSTHQAYCYVFAESKSQKTLERLKALKTAKNGFELSELDLQLRGAGELYGRRQWGLSDIAMEAIKNIKMVEAARTEARRLISEDPELKRYPLLHKYIAEAKEIHFE